MNFRPTVTMQWGFLFLFLHYMNHTPEKNIQTIRDILEDEIRGDVAAALEKMTDDYSMTWVYKRRDNVLFPAVAAENIRAAMKDVYVVKGRRYDIRHIIAEGDVVMAELVESYPDEEKPGVFYRTPMVIVWEFSDGKIRAGRHYCDPQLSYLNLSEEEVKNIYK